MGDEKDAAPKSDAPKTASNRLEGLSLDFKTVKTIVLSTFAVCALVSVPLFFILRNFVTFDSLDKYLKLTESVRPKILHDISEELSTGYSKNFVFDSTQSSDNTMLFHANEKQRVTVSINGTPVSGVLQAIPIEIKVNHCTVRESSPDPLEMFDFELTKQLQGCPPDQRDLHTLRIVFPKGLPKDAVYQVRCLVLVYERVHDHIGDK